MGMLAGPGRELSQQKKDVALENKSWSFVDKSNWAKGSWNNEPDKVQWSDETTGLPCLAVRHGELGHWCGYVGVNNTHPFYKQGYNDVSVDCHGGLTFADSCNGSEHGVCHVVEPGEDDHIWWLGFDCAHSGDKSPGMEANMRKWSTGFPYDDYHKDDHYWTLADVQAECKELASQIQAKVVAP